MTAVRMIVTVAGLGYLRPAPGTWASAVAVATGVLIHQAGGFPLLLAATVLVTVAGILACRADLAGRPHEDPSEIVIDEVAGQWMALLFPSYAFWSMDWAGWMPWPAWVAAFGLFRLFDIWKPWLVGRADRMPGHWGVMLDDLWAGVFAGLGIVLLAGLYHGVLLL